MRVGNYPVYDETGNEIDVDYLETDKISDLRNVLQDEEVSFVDSNSIIISYAISYNEENNMVVIDAMQKNTINKLASHEIPVLEFADALNNACKNDTEIDNEDVIKWAKDNIKNILGHKYISYDVPISVSGWILADNNYIGTFENIEFAHSYDKTSIIVILSSCVCDKIKAYIGSKSIIKIYFTHNNSVYVAECNFVDNEIENSSLVKSKINMTIAMPAGSKCPASIDNKLSVSDFILPAIEYKADSRETVEAFYGSRKNALKQKNKNNVEEIESNMFGSLFEL